MKISYSQIIVFFFQFQEDLDSRYNMEKEKLYKIRLLQVSENKSQ